MRKIMPVVEGDGEVRAVPVLLRRILQYHELYGDVRVEEPIKRHRGNLVKQDGLEKAMLLATQDPECAAVLILFDEDDDCACDLGPPLRTYARSVRPNLPVYLRIAVKEYEAWLLAGMESLRGHCGVSQEAEPPPDGAESVRDAKGWIKKYLTTGRTYAETTDQEKLTAVLDFKLAASRSRSFQKLWGDLADLVTKLGGTPKPLL